MCHICGWFEHASERDVWVPTPGRNIAPAFVHFSGDAWIAKADWTDNRGSMEGCCIGLGTIQESLVGAKVRTWVQNETRNKNSILAIHNPVGIKFSISCNLGVGALVEAGSQLAGSQVAGTQTCKLLFSCLSRTASQEQWLLCSILSTPSWDTG